MNRLIGFHRELALFRARAQGDDFYSQDMARYSQAKDTQTLLCDGERARTLWLGLLGHSVGSWQGAADTARPGPCGRDAYLASARILLALNYRDMNPKDSQASEALLDEVIASGVGVNERAPHVQGARCHLAESKASSGDKESARLLFSDLKVHTKREVLVKMIEERIAALDRE